MTSPPSVATVVITTKNRKDDLAVALRSVFSQTVPIEVIVIDDGSTDGTDEFVSNNFPDALLYRFDVSRGLIAQRNYGADVASCEIIFSIDDDAEFSTPNVIESVLSEFSDPRIVAVAIPFINVKQSQIVNQLAPDKCAIWITNEFIGTAHALRKREFKEAGGYSEHFFHQGEEGDYCIRALDKGNFVRIGSSDPILHYESPKRSNERINRYGQRNLMLFAWQNVPVLWFPVHFIATICNGLIWGIRNGCFKYRVQGTLFGFQSIFQYFKFRKPVSVATYRKYRKLKNAGCIRLSDITGDS